MRLDRLGDNGQADARKRQRADAVARMLGHMVTVGDLRRRALAALALLGVSPVVAISSAGFVGFAIAISGQHLANDVIAGTRALLEDRYAAGDEVDPADRRHRRAGHGRPDRFGVDRGSARSMAPPGMPATRRSSR